MSSEVALNPEEPAKFRGCVARRKVGVGEMLQHIRAASRMVRQQAKEGAADPRVTEMLHFSRLLSMAIRQASAFDIAVVLGSAAELRWYPDDRALDLCTQAVEGAGNAAFRAVVWTVRHRRDQGTPHARRFVVPDVR